LLGDAKLDDFRHQTSDSGNSDCAINARF